MKLFTCFVVFLIFDITTSLKSKSVNLELETVLQFDNRDNSADVQFINNVQSFLDKIKLIINKNPDGRRSNGNPGRHFTGFLIDVCATLKKYNDEDLEDVLTIIDNELRKYHYKGCKFYELIENNDVRRYMGTKLKDLKNKSAKETRYILKKVLRLLVDKNYDSGLKGLLDYVNSLYRSDDKHKFRSVLNNLDNYKSNSKRANLDLIRIVREGVRSILFDHYTALNPNARRELKLKIETFWKDPSYVRHQIWNIKYTKSVRDQYGRIDVVQEDSTYPLNMSFVNVSMTSASTNSSVPTTFPFNITLPTWTTSPNKTANPTTKQAMKRRTKRTKRRKKSKSARLDPGYQIEGKDSMFGTRFVDITRRPHRYRTTTKERLHTLWEEQLIRSAEGPAKTIISNHETEINVKRTKIPKHHKKKHERKRLRLNKHRQQQKRFYIHHGPFTSPKFRVFSKSPGTVTFRKSQSHHITSEEGMSIESFENIVQKKISLRKSNDNSTFGLTNIQTVDSNVMRRINNLEIEVNDMKSKIEVKIPISTTTIGVEQNYVLDFWKGTPKAEIVLNQSTTNQTPTSILTTTPKAINNEKVTEIKWSTAISVTEPKTFFIPVNNKAFDNITRVFNDTSRVNENKANVVPFSDKIDNGTIHKLEDMKNDLLSVKNNFTASPVLEIHRDRNDTTNLEKNVTEHPRIPVEEKVTKKWEDILKNITTHPDLVLPTILHNETMPNEFEDPFKDVDMGMDFM